VKTNRDRLIKLSVVGQVSSPTMTEAGYRIGASGNPVQSNRTDNESAKMATGKGVIQGYTGVATVDAAMIVFMASITTCSTVKP
jgi:hypothetical protein